MERKRDLDYIIIAVLLVTGLYAVVSGAIADRFGFPRFLFHSQAGYACAILGAVHLTFNRRRVMSYVRQRLRGRQRTADPQRTGVRPTRGSRGEAAPESRIRRPQLNRRALISSAVSVACGFVMGRLLPGRRLAPLSPPASDPGAAYHESSKPSSLLAPGEVYDWGRQPDPLKTYPDTERIALPDASGWSGLSTEAAMETRRSMRTYRRGPLPTEQLSRVLHAACGVTDEARGYRTAPSAGALYPIEVYPVVHDVAGLTAGLYHYLPAAHSLELVRPGDMRAAMVTAGAGQEMAGRAQVCLILSAVFQRTRWRYRERTYRYVLLEAGHIGQNVYLAAAALGLGTCAIGAFLDDNLNDLLGIDGNDEASLYILTLGLA
jgi:SagB-type dehydrogenase family enzyme